MDSRKGPVFGMCVFSEDDVKGKKFTTKVFIF